MNARPVMEKGRPRPVTNPGGSVIYPLKPVSITASISRGLPRRTLHCKGYHGFVGRVHRPLDHSAPGRKRPPKLSKALCPTRSLKTLTAPGRFAPQMIHRVENLFAYGPAAAVHVDGDDFPAVVRLHLRADVPFVDLLAQAGCLFPGAAGRHRRLRFPQGFLLLSKVGIP